MAFQMGDGITNISNRKKKQVILVNNGKNGFISAEVVYLGRMR